ncbi:hypothetical protein DEU56DRAFT_733389 [Suillus clintonianus]|uniref:uncharacterized protein n=1 Tax=Suillus clintonianus TaxID=1904413 RepID=UPI001B85CFC5|nr:uncharacterized protein DEU56DRAFT_733389 [Suillus clintonianus]KAG2142985.1 hypothetical protein DEU56DRAFT_733389 [Suillus clintonianus]
MERTLKLFRLEDMLVSDLKINSKGKAVQIPHKLNKALGKTSTAQGAFSDTNYGVATRGYMKSINCLDESVLQDIWECAKEIASKRCRAAPILVDDSDDERALIFDNWYCLFLS